MVAKKAAKKAAAKRGGGSGDGRVGEWQVVWREIRELRPYGNNPRTHSAEQIALLAEMIGGPTGWTQPLVIDDTGMIFAGHARLEAARLIANGDERYRVPTVVLSHLTEEQARAYIIADNQLAARAGWDDALLKAEVEALRDAGFGVGLRHETERLHRRLLGVSAFRSGWEADHIVARAEGGCDHPENLRTLCRPCHVARTAAQRAEWADRARRAAELAAASLFREVGR